MEYPERASDTPIQLPVFDISKINPDVGKSMIDAATKYGFLYVDSNSSDFADHDVEGAFEMAQRFFAQPREEKAEFKIGTDNTGWVGMHREILDPDNQQRGDFKEAMNIREFKGGKAQQDLPPLFASREADLNNFLNSCQSTCNRILALLALGLEIPTDWFTIRHDPSKGPSGCTFRLLYYPSISSSSPGTTAPSSAAAPTYDPSVDIRAGAHSDYGSVTLLFQRDGEPGLEIQTPTGEWAGVPVRPQQGKQHQSSANEDGVPKKKFPPILVNIGDLLSYWTCGLLKSTVHRVVFPHVRDQHHGAADDRYSMVYFCHPLHSAELVPVPSRLVDEHRQQMGPSTDGNDGVEADAGVDGGGVDGKVLTAQQHLASRLAATYGGLAADYMRE